MRGPCERTVPSSSRRLNPIIKANGEGTLFGNVLLQKYLKNTKLVKSATSPGEIENFKKLIAIFRKYGSQYSVDYLLMMAQGFQESRLDQTVKSPVGAIGIMQVMPATAKDLKVGDVHQIDSNVAAGVKYMRFMIDQYYKDEPMDDLNKGLFAFASYNAGPARIRQLRKLAANARLESQRVVQQRGARRRREDRAGDGDLRGEHLQVLRRVHADDAGARREGESQGDGWRRTVVRNWGREDFILPTRCLYFGDSTLTASACV